MGIKVEEINDGDGRRLLEPFIFYDGVRADMGWEWDGNTVPLIFAFIIQPFRDLELSCRHDLDCAKARVMMKAALSGTDKVDRKALLQTAKEFRSVADKRYKTGTIKRRKIRNGKVIGNTIGWLAFAGVRVGSFFGVGW